MKRNHKFLATVALTAMLAACGGGGSDQPVVAADPLSELPASASQSTAAMASYMTTLATLQADSREPLAIEAFNPPKPDDTEPESVGG